MPSEFAEFIEVTAKRLDLTVSDYEVNTLQPDAARLEAHMTSSRQPTQIYLRPSAPDRVEAEGVPKDAIPTALGWVQIDCPLVDGRILFLADIGSKSDWYEEGVVREGAGHALFNRVVRRLRQQVSAPVIGTNVIYGGSDSYSDLHYSPGAARWQAEGGELAQYGVDNVRFMIPTTTSPTR